MEARYMLLNSTLLFKGGLDALSLSDHLVNIIVSLYDIDLVLFSRLIRKTSVGKKDALKSSTFCTK